jgi:ABC-type taurine transport system substrate-binding protein
MEDLVAQTINNKDELILQRGAEIERLEAIVNCKAVDALKQDEEIGRLRAMFNAQNQRALKQDEEIDRLQRLLDTKSEDVLQRLIACSSRAMKRTRELSGAIGKRTPSSRPRMRV